LEKEKDQIRRWAGSGPRHSGGPLARLARLTATRCRLGRPNRAQRPSPRSRAPERAQARPRRRTHRHQNKRRGGETPAARATLVHRSLAGHPHMDRTRKRRRGGGEGETSPDRGTFPAVKGVTAVEKALMEFLHISRSERGVRRSSCW
jgi:hypothetical protein